MKNLIAMIILAFASTPVFSENPKACAGPDHWAANSAYAYLKNAGLIHNETTDFKKTKVVLVASEQIGKDLYRQVQHIMFTETTGGVIDVITVNDAASEECSMGGVQVFVVSKQFGDGPN